MPEDKLVTATEVARLAGVGRAAVSNWRRRYQDFPEPTSDDGAPAFRLTEVEAWLRAQGKLGRVRPVDALWRVLDRTVDTRTEDLVAAVVDRLSGGSSPLPGVVEAALEAVAAVPAAEVIDDLLARLFERQQLLPFGTRVELAEMMIKVAQPIGDTVFDPACGAGTLLAAAARAGASQLAGQEINPAVGRFATLRLRAHPGSEVVIGDTLRADAFPELRANTVVCDPPFGYRDWGREQLVVDSRWEYGVPVKTEPELAWVQHCLAHAKPGGTVVVTVPAGVAFRRSGRLIRQNLLRRGVFRAIVALPPGVLRSTGIGLQLWVLRAPDTEVRPILMVDAGGLRPPRRGQVDWPALREAVERPWREFSSAGTVSEMPGRRGVVEPIDLLDEDVDLTPARHLPKPPIAVDVNRLDRQRTELVELTATLPELLPKVVAGERPSTAMITINELARAGALTLTSAPPRLDIDEKGTGPLVLTGRDVATGQPPRRRLAAPAGQEPVALRPGDVVVPVLMAEDRPRLTVIDEEGLLLGPNLVVLRADPERLEPEFLAGVLTTSASWGMSATGSGVHRLDVRRVEIPMLDIAEQRGLGQQFSRLRRLRAAVHRLAELGDSYARQVAEGLTSRSLIGGQ